MGSKRTALIIFPGVNCKNISNLIHALITLLGPATNDQFPISNVISGVLLDLYIDFPSRSRLLKPHKHTCTTQLGLVCPLERDVQRPWGVGWAPCRLQLHVVHNGQRVVGYCHINYRDIQLWRAQLVAHAHGHKGVVV